VLSRSNKREKAKNKLYTYSLEENPYNLGEFIRRIKNIVDLPRKRKIYTETERKKESSYLH
jgi:hypothetical protein